MNDKISHFKEIISKIPHKPGVYFWKINDHIIYIGKAKDLFNRLTQYITKQDSDKVISLINEANNIEYIITNKENDALILENNLIFKHKPKYNVLLRENSCNYPYIVITDEKFSRILLSRKNNISGEYFGPIMLPSLKKHDLYNLLLELFPLRKCNNKLPKTKCLYYDIGECLGPCINNISSEQINTIKQNIKSFLLGKHKDVLNLLNEKEKNYVKLMNYEQAKKMHELQSKIKEIDLKNTILLSNNKHIDIIGIYIIDEKICINVFSYLNGILNNISNDIFSYILDPYSAIEEYLFQYYFKNKNLPTKIYIENKFDFSHLQANLNITFVTPKKGKFDKLIKNANENAKHYYKSNITHYTSEINNFDIIVKSLNTLLSTNYDFNIIDFFDVSNLFGSSNVAGMICIKDGKFYKNNYRKFIIKDKTKKGDCEYYSELVNRQYKNNCNLPSVIFVDGDIAQCTAAEKELSKLAIAIPVFGIYKNDSHKTEGIVFQNKKYKIDKNSILYKFLYIAQEEVHRFAISFHRKKHNKLN